MIEIVWFRGSDGVYFRWDHGPIEKGHPALLYGLLLGEHFALYRLVQAADQPDYIRWPQ